jgi:hypothetical protein
MIGLLAAMLLAAAPAASASVDRCSEKTPLTQCYWSHHGTILRFYGLAPIEQHVAAGERVIRAFYFDRVGHSVVEVEFTRLTGQGPSVTIRRGGSYPGSASVPISQAEWDQLWERARYFDRAMTPQPDPLRTDGAIVVCGDGALEVVEASQPDRVPGRQLRRRVEHSCEPGRAIAFARYAAETAARLLPACALLREPFGSAEAALQACAGLSGDRIAAAEAVTLARTLDFAAANDEPLGRFFEDRAPVEIGGATASLPAVGAAAWRAALGGDGRTHFFVLNARGESVGRVVLEGSLEVWRDGADGKSTFWVAHVEQVWTSGQDGFAVERAKISAFAPVSGLCSPGLLTGRDTERINHCHY